MAQSAGGRAGRIPAGSATGCLSPVAVASTTRGPLQASIKAVRAKAGGLEDLKRLLIRSGAFGGGSAADPHQPPSSGSTCNGSCRARGPFVTLGHARCSAAVVAWPPGPPRQFPGRLDG